MNRGCRGDIAELESCLRASYPDVHRFREAVETS